MSTLIRQPFFMPGASMGQDNPLPDIKSMEDMHAKAPVDRTTVSEEEARYMGWGRVKGILPYTIRDGYDRVKRRRAFDSFVLENAHLKATFLPGLGGRLWSLVDKHTGRELLHVNPVFQPCNLALRNAWISGGVEWNCGIIGHTPFTVDPLFVRTKVLQDGTPVLSMYQYERVRRLVYRVEAMLPEDSRYLLVRVRIDNTTQEDTAVYWWSNIAVDERPDVRVVVPAEQAFHFGSEAGVHKVGVPQWEGQDLSYPAKLPYAMDFFFDLKDGQRRFITALGEDGYGLVQCSTAPQRGRKLFVWGNGKGGKHWQTFLSQPGSAYIEIQAGLARTQLEHLPMAGGATIGWLEAYGPLQTDPKKTQAPAWRTAVQETERALEQALPRAGFRKLDESVCAQMDREEGWGQVSMAEGWAALEQQERGKGFSARGLSFPAASVKGALRPWRQLLTKGVLPQADPLQAPASYQAGKGWYGRVKRSLKQPGGRHWYSLYQLGVLEAHQGNREEAAKAFRASIRLAPSPWAHWCLAVLHEQHGQMEDAARHALKAVALKPDRHVALEALRILHKAGQDEQAITLYDSLPRGIQSLGRAKASLIAACLATGDLRRAEKLLHGPLVVADVREGEVSLSALWYELMARKLAKEKAEAYAPAHLEAVSGLTPPEHLDFRMKVKA